MSQTPQKSLDKQEKAAKDKLPAITKPGLRATSLGGLHELGKNTWLIEAIAPDKNSEYLILDAGVLYPGKDSPGVDYQVSHSSVLDSLKGKITTLVLTSYHEWHSGAAIHYMAKFPIKKVYGSKLALLALKNKLSEQASQKVDFVEFESRKELTEGAFNLMPFRITNSSHDAYSLVIESSDQRIFYTGTFKIDQTPSDAVKCDISGISQYCIDKFDQKKPVNILISNSAGVEVEGYSKSEITVGPKLEKIIKEHNSRVIINLYNSSTLRLVNIFDVAVKLDRKIVLLNRDARQVYKVLDQAGYISDAVKEQLVNVTEFAKFNDEQLLIVMTAPEGEALEELENVAFDKSLDLQIKKDDLIINSGDLPPGTVRLMAQISDQIFLKEAKIMGGTKDGLHVRPNALTEEMKFLFNLIRPKYFLPAFGETRHLIRHAKLAVDAGQDPGSIFILDRGDIFEASSGDVEVIGKTDTSDVLFNDSQDFHVDNKIVKERASLSTEGVVMVNFTLNKKRELVSGPVFSARACTFSKNKEWRAFCLMNSQSVVDVVATLKEENPDASIEDYQNAVIEYMNRIIKQQIGKKSSVIVLINEIAK